MRNLIHGTALAAVMTLAGAAPALAGGMTFDMFTIEKKGMGAKIGQIGLEEAPDGVSMNLDLSDLPPGKDRMFLYEAEKCPVGMDDKTASLLAELNVETDEDGAEPLKTTIKVSGMSMDDMMGKVVMIERGSLGESQQPEQTGAPRRVACGIVK